MDDDSHTYPDVVISGALALALVDALEWAAHRTTGAESTAREEFARMSYALEYEIRDAAPPMRWVVPAGTDALPASIAARDEVRTLPWIMHDQAGTP
ncbi:hypothetical protein ACIQFP_10485 [Nocardiopsis alba]|uniref:hypothetical protein n=1 Tax=Nocardiopsis alba TaxID=53437 RepID=UPI003815127E